MVANAKPSFSPEELQKIFEMYPELRNAFASVKEAHSQDRQDAKIVAAFHRRGFKDAVLFDRSKLLTEQLSTVTILSYKKWFECGRKVRTGEKAVRIKGYSIPLFHRSQTEPATPAERKKFFQAEQAKQAKKEAKASAQEQPST
jgi:hypothetical protein